MEVILLDKISNLGGLGDKVKVKNGYARNFLIPQGKAKTATPENIKEFEARRSELLRKSQDTLLAAQGRKEALEAVGSVTILSKAGTEGKLFGSVGNIDIVEAVKAAGQDIEKSEVRLPQGNLRDVGEYEVVLHLHTDVECTLKVIVQAEE
jgi:large subunit ribosomal protein L9